MENGTIMIDGKKFPVLIKDLVYVTIPFIPNLVPGIKERAEALLIGGHKNHVVGTRSMPDGGVMVVVKSNSSTDNECQLIENLLAKDREPSGGGGN